MGRGDIPAIRSDGNRQHRAAAGRQHLDVLPIALVPEAQGLVAAAADDQRRVGDRCEASHTRGVAVVAQHLAPGLHVPQANHAILAAGEQALAVFACRDAAHRAGVAAEPAHLLGGAGVP